MFKLLAPAFLVVVSAAPSIAADAPSLSERYRGVSERLIAAAMSDTEGYERLTYLCDRIGPRLSGSAALNTAIAWSAEQMKSVGLENVRLVPAKVPNWVRGAESARMTAPYDLPLHMLGLGMSVGTPPGGITAEVVAVSDFNELAKLGRENVAGKIVLYNEPFRGYGPTVTYRSTGASRAAALGAVGALVRSVTPLAAQLPHTGTMQYDQAQPKIPAAAVSPEDAMMMARLIASGVRVKVHLEMGAQTLPDADSANVIGDLPGSELPDEIVVLGGHSDSWDVGQGAQDDGAAIMASLEAVSLMKKLGLRPRRTVRVAIWVNEENGSRGGEAYRAWLGDQVSKHVAAIEMDGGAETPRGYGASVDEPSRAILRDIARLLEGIGAGSITAQGGGEDIRPLMEAGVPGLSEQTLGTHYFDWHHSAADTLDKVTPEDFRKNMASLAVMSYVLADMPGRLAASPR